MVHRRYTIVGGHTRVLPYRTNSSSHTGSDLRVTHFMPVLQWLECTLERSLSNHHSHCGGGLRVDGEMSCATIGIDRISSMVTTHEAFFCGFRSCAMSMPRQYIILTVNSFCDSDSVMRSVLRASGPYYLGQVLPLETSNIGYNSMRPLHPIPIPTRPSSLERGIERDLVVRRKNGSSTLDPT